MRALASKETADTSARGDIALTGRTAIMCILTQYDLGPFFYVYFTFLEIHQCNNNIDFFSGSPLH